MWNVFSKKTGSQHSPFVCMYVCVQWHPTLVLLAGKSHGWRSLVGCSPWGRWESDMTKRLHFHFSLSCIGEGNGGPLQCSCLENPRDGGAWWAAVYGVTQSQTRLKWLSSSSSSMCVCVCVCIEVAWGVFDRQTKTPHRNEICRYDNLHIYIYIYIYDNLHIYIYNFK